MVRESERDYQEPRGHGTVLHIDRGGGYTICKCDSMELCTHCTNVDFMTLTS